MHLWGQEVFPNSITKGPQRNWILGKTGIVKIALVPETKNENKVLTLFKTRSPTKDRGEILPAQKEKKRRSTGAR